jgi:hypothetical protein
MLALGMTAKTLITKDNVQQYIEMHKRAGAIK